MLKKYFRDNSPFLKAWGVFWIFMAIIIGLYPKPGSFLFLNYYHAPFLDSFFRVITFLGDGWFVIIMALVFFFLKKRALSFMILSSYLLSGVFVQVIKRFFPEPRPSMYLQSHHIEYTGFIEGVTLHNSYSFPSGHTTSVFALAACIALFYAPKRLGILLAVIAFLVGYSRIYLGQHFPEDVFVGMFLGTISTILCFVWLGKLFYKWQDNINRRKVI